MIARRDEFKILRPGVIEGAAEAAGTEMAATGDVTMRDLPKALLLAAGYTLFAKIGLSIQPVNTFATLVWPPTGIALAALLLLGNRFWPAIAIGAVVANVWTGAPILVALGIGAGNTLEALLGSFALSRITGFRRSLDRLQDVIGLVLLACAVSTAVSATIGVLSLQLGGLITPNRFGATWRAWWLGDAISDLVVAPLLLTWKPAADAPVPRGRWAEATVLGVCLVVASLAIFDRTTHGMASLLSPLLVWAAIRFNERGAARATFVISAIAIWATARGHGPFARLAVSEGLFSLQAFVLLTSATFLVLGAVMSERRRAHLAAIESDRTEQEMELAAAIQREILPRSLPEVAGVEIAAANVPTRHVGGDYYDAFPLSRGRLGFLVADVSGKGVSAALLVSTVHAAVHLQIDEAKTILDLVSRIDRHLRRYAATRKFLTLFFGIFEPDSGLLTYVSAGHNPALLLGRSGILTQLASTGVPVGMFPDASWRQETVTLRPRDLLCVYTDGLTDAVNSAEEEFGLDRLSSLVARGDEMPLQALCDRMLADVADFAGDVSQYDDQTLLLLRRTQGPPSG